MKIIELFAGIGSQAMALRNIGADYEIVGISEIDKFAIISYNAIHGETKNFGDITKIKELPKCDLVTLSFPCQSLSISGKQEGIKKGTESGLLLEVKRLLKNEAKNGKLPEWLLMENVKNLVSKKFMPQFQKWLDFLESIGYETKWEVLNAKDYGVPQNRERVFAVSRLGKNNFEFPRKVELKKTLKDILEKGNIPEKYYISKASLKTLTSMQDRNGYVRGKAFKGIVEEKADFAYTLKASGGTRPTDNYIIQIGNIGNLEKFGGNPQTGRVYNSQGICPALSTMQGGNRQPKVVTEFPKNFCRKRYDIEICPTIRTKDGQCLSDLIEAGYVIRKLTPLECWRVMGFSDEDFEKAKAIGTSDTQLYKQAGNSIVVDVLEGIFKNIIKADKENKKTGV